MTRARDLANFVNGIDASKITSGTFADARISNSSVSQYASTFDDNKIINDISTLGLRVHTQENLNASNTNSASFDVFQDSSAISNLTNCVRDSSEFISSNIPAQFNTNDATLSTNILNLYKMDNALTDSIGNQNLLNSPDGSGSNVIFSSTLKKLGTHSAYFDGSQYSEFAFDNGSGAQGVPYFHTNNSNGSYPPSALSIAYWVYWTPDNNNWNMVFDGYHTATDAKRNYIFAIGHDGSTANSHDKPAIWDGLDQNWGIAQDGGSETPVSAISHSTWIHIVQTLTSTKKQIFVNGSLSGSAQTGTFGFGSNGGGAHQRIGGRSSSSAYQFKGNLDQFCIWDRELNATDASNLYNSGNGNNYNPAQNNATGSFEGNAITVSSTNKMGAVITYQDNAGTNALNTDIVLKLSADNGSNYSTATLTALPDFATGIKMAKVNDLSVTAGTQLKYKIEFANQASGSKEARIRGVSLQY